MPDSHLAFNFWIMETFEKKFAPKAHILTLLGEELIRSPVMAIYELVKNSYDADATQVSVIFNNSHDIGKGRIVVEDNGVGMTKEIVENVWLEPGSDFRKPVGTDGQRTIRASAKFGRVPMGEKGIGRFAVHKLANRILLITRPMIQQKPSDGSDFVLADYEIRLEIDWREFSQNKYLSDVLIKWQVAEDQSSFHFKDESGTRIELSAIKESWTRRMARALKKATLSMIDPKEEDSTIQISIDFQNNWLDGLASAKMIVENAPYNFSVTIDEEYNINGTYNFAPKNTDRIGWRSNDFNECIRLGVVSFFAEQIKSEGEKDLKVEQIRKMAEEMVPSKLPIGKISFEIYSFDLDSKSLRDTMPNFRLIKEILKDYSGIKVYKDGMRVFDYGEPGNDWLGLDLGRVQNPGQAISNNQNIGYVYLDATQSSSLVEKTNREGFIQNSAYRTLEGLLKVLLSIFQAERFKDREKWININRSDKASSLDSRFKKMKDEVENAEFANENSRQKLLETIDEAAESYEQERETFLIPAGVGMSASIALHEIEKLVPRMENNSKGLPNEFRELKENIAELSHYVEGIINILQKSKGELIERIGEVLNRAAQNYKGKTDDRKINVIIDVDASMEPFVCDRRLLITSIMNLMDNSIYWLENYNKEDKTIYLRAVTVDGKKHIIVGDNGPGYTDDLLDLVRPFFTRKHQGMGIGLYLVDNIMMKYGKFDIISNPEEKARMGIPESIDGAIARMSFFKN